MSPAAIDEGAPALVAEAAQRALCEEPLVWPRFGLVGGEHAGAHHDMDYPLLVTSARSLRRFFHASAALGLSRPRSEAGFDQLRAMGRQAEGEMLLATGGVNTHKGAVFLLGLLCCAWGWAARSSGRRRLWPAPSPTRLFDEAYAASHRAIASEIASPHVGLSQTYGEWAMQRHRWRGARGVVADDFRLLRRAMSWQQTRRSGDGAALGHLRHYFFAFSEDTNLLKRAGHDATNLLLRRARELFGRRGILDPIARRDTARLERYMVKRRFSAAAAGDLVGGVILLNKLKEHGLLASA